MEFPLSFLILLAAVSLYLIYGALYRLILSPVARFPGPKLAALTFWYEFYYDVICKGRYTWKIEQLHKKYGPIIRINPQEIHVNDPTFFDQVYVGPARRTDKWYWAANMFGTTQAAVGTVNHDLHKLRRSALSPYFSVKTVSALQPLIMSQVEILRTRLKEVAGTGKPVNLMHAFACEAGEIAGSYCFGQSYGFLKHPDFYPNWHNLMTNLGRNSQLMKQFHWVYPIVTKAPEIFLRTFFPIMGKLLDLQNDLAAKIEEEQRNQSLSSSKDETVSQTIVEDFVHHSKLPAQELRVPRLTEEFLTLVTAGTVTTSYTLVVAAYHLLSNTELLQRLREELSTLPTGQRPSWQTLTGLPYLTGVVNESLRLSYGVSQRLSRVFPDTDLQYGNWDIPRGTPVSLTQMFIHNDPNIFPKPMSFIPERWLPSSSGAYGDLDTLKHYLVPFSRGTRQCVGMNLAYAEIYLTLSTLFAPVEKGGVDMELYETTYKDIEVAHDYFSPAIDEKREGLRVIVKE